MTKRQPPKNASKLQKIWYFLWYDDSLLSWAANLVLAFILIKFIVYPLLGLVFGTQLPLVAVISESMEHDQPFEEWWGENCIQDVCPQSSGDWYRENNITKNQFQNFPLRNGFNRGDVILLTAPRNLDKGDVVVFASAKPYPIIHRIVDSSNRTYTTKGDNNPKPIVDANLNERAVKQQHIIGKAKYRIPYIGYLKLLFVDGLQALGIMA